MELIEYHKEHMLKWDGLVKSSSKGHFMFQRSYMDYHEDRFEDASLLFEKKGKIVAVFPANRKEDGLFSHQGLTFGGIIHASSLSVQEVEVILGLIIEHAKSKEIKDLHYKAVPEFYHRSACCEDLFALSRKGFSLVRRDVSSLVNLHNPVPFSKDRRYRLNKSRRNKLTAGFSDDVRGFMQIVEKNLSEKFEVVPTHSADEMGLLHTRFPENIALRIVQKEGEILAGAILYLYGPVVHTQYMHSSDEGKKLNAMEFLIGDLKELYSSECAWLDFGISTEEDGMVLNSGLIDFKQGFGGRAKVHDFYRLEL